MKNKKQKKENKIVSILLAILIFLDLVLVLGLNWVIINIGVVSIDEVIFHLKVPLKGTSHDLIYEAIKSCLIPAIIITVLFVYLILMKHKTEVTLKIKLFKINLDIHLKKIIKKIALVLGIVVFIYQLGVINDKFKVISYLKNQVVESKFIEENYVDAEKAEITFKGKKRNLIYIFLESMESTFIDKEHGGSQDKDLIPELTELASTYTNFSNNDKIGGAAPSTGAGWTAGALVAQTSGLPLTIPIDGNAYEGYKEFLPGAYTLGDVLTKHGYNQVVMFGSYGDFGGRQTYFETHGDVNVKDLLTAKKEKIVPEDYYVFWGIEDSKLIEYAKKEITRLSKENKPFNLSLLTANTHFSEGYKEEDCTIDTGNHYADSITCSSKQIYDFVKWIQEQSFYEDTTIILSGDHVSMAKNKLYDGVKEEERKVYNVIINSALDAKNNKNRVFTTFDMYPTTLASIGATIKGDRLGLGTNLYSNKKTLAEEYGIDYINEELQKRSNFYNNNILYKK